MNVDRNKFNQALRSEVGRQMFTSVPFLVIFTFLILAGQTFLFFYSDRTGAAAVPAILSLCAALFPVILYLVFQRRKFSRGYLLFTFILLFFFYSLEVFLFIFTEMQFIAVLIFIIQILGGYYLLSNSHFYILQSLNLLALLHYLVADMKLIDRIDSLFILFFSVFVSFLIQKDRRKEMVNLSALYRKQRETGDRFRQLEENIKQVFILCSSDFSQFYYISSAFERMLPLNRREFLENPEIWRDFIHPGDRLRVELEIESARNDRNFRDFDFRYEAGDTLQWLRFQIFPVLSEISGESDRLAIIIDDITKSKSAELKLAEARSIDGELAARIQRNLLFSSSDLNITGLDICAESIPSLEVGGDYFDLYRFSDSIADIIIADVMGKGMIASMLGAASKSAFMKSRLDLTVQDGTIPSIDRIVSRVNRSIADELIKMGKFITLQYARIDMTDRIFSFTDNGHTSILHYSARMKCCWSLKGWNMPLGFNSEEEEIVGIIPMEENDLFFLYSDGIIEAENEEGEQFGERRLAYVLNNSHTLTSSQIITKIRNLIFHYSSSEGFADDVTAIALKISGSREFERVERFVFPGKRESLRDVRDFIASILGKHRPEMERELVDLLVLALNEAVANVVEHNYEKDESLSGREVFLEVSLKGKYVFFRLFWDGEEFDWSNVKAPDIEEMKGGGYGLSLMKTIMDSISFSSNIDGVQQLCMVKEIGII